MQTRRLRSQAGDGYSLIELLVVLGIISLLALALPAAFSAGRPGIAARTAAQSLGDALRRARLLAVSENREVQLLVDIDKKTIRVGRDKPIALDGTSHLECMQACAHGEKNAAIAFFPDGSASGGSIAIASGLHRYLVGVKPISGRVFVDADH